MKWYTYGDVDKCFVVFDDRGIGLFVDNEDGKAVVIFSIWHTRPNFFIAVVKEIVQKDVPENVWNNAVKEYARPFIELDWLKHCSENQIHR